MGNTLKAVRGCFKACFYFPQIITKIIHTCIIVCHSISFLPYFIILDKKNSVKLSHPKWVLLKLDRGGARENTLEGHTGPNKSSFSPYKQVSVRNDDHEWIRTTNSFILYDLFWKVQKSHAAKEALNSGVVFLKWIWTLCLISEP